MLGVTTGRHSGDPAKCQSYWALTRLLISIRKTDGDPSPTMHVVASSYKDGMPLIHRSDDERSPYAIHHRSYRGGPPVSRHP